MSGLVTAGTFGRQELSERAGGYVLSKTAHSAGIVLPRHGHKNASIVVVLDGGYHETFNGVSDVHAAGTVITKPPGETHSNDFTGTSATCLLVEPDGAELDRIRGHSDLFCRPSCFASPTAALIAQQIVKELRKPDALTPLQLESAALALIVRCSEARRSHYPRETRWLERARELLHELPPGAATLSTIAAELEIHPVHLARAFKQAFGLTVGAYARRLQMDRAVDLLINSDTPLGEVAQIAGFYDQSHMARLLRQQTGMTASQIRSSAAG